ncbi:hypothetical protein [Asticcacaulis machinosus]|uniref:Uncharacterized protein n=1 Tax=Asticcacaulis machinosus TaxID=2984211 RepID=A0ABT5HE93_9CAUL|nr:hypothetical protein [Asticcacaulis machinosus]MDC7674580.1 hypothetical protein [Asticcacaulis machinosus]
MTQMYGLYRAKAGEGSRDLVCYGDGEVEFITSRAAYEATGMTPLFSRLPWRPPLDDRYQGLEHYAVSP